jgi:hypothetical protein
MFDVILAAVTLASLSLAGVMGIVTWWVLSLERRRFDARVEELSSAAAEPDGVDTVRASIPLQPAICTDPDPRTSVRESMPGLFADPAPVTSNSRRAIIAAALGSAVFALAFAVVIALNPVSARETPISPAAARVAVPIELVLLDHVRTGRGLSIHGLVHNPAGGASLRDLVAIVFLFNGNGEQVGTTQAAVMATVLAPGGETCFDVPVVDGQHVARYRVTFRTAGTPVPHVDRRIGTRPAVPDAARTAVKRHAAWANVQASLR